MMDFRRMRRSRQELPAAETEQILKDCSTGILSVLGENGYPYAVPLNYAYLNGKIYFHCAKTGHKLDAIRQCERVCFCAVERDRVIARAFATDYRSVVLFGRARLISEEETALKREALEALNRKYAPDFYEEGQEEIRRDWSNVQLVEIQIDHMTGKEAKKTIQEME